MGRAGLCGGYWSGDLVSRFLVAAEFSGPAVDTVSSSTTIGCLTLSDSSETGFFLVLLRVCKMFKVLIVLYFP